MIRRDANWNGGTNLPPIGSTPYHGLPPRGLSVCALPSIGAPYAERRAAAPGVPTPAITPASYLHVSLYLTSGGRHSFVQRDAKAAQSLLQQLRPERLFAQKHLMLASRGSVTAIPCAFIERVELRSDQSLAHPQRPGIGAVEQVTEEDFHRMEHRISRERIPQEFGMAIELASGSAFYLRVHLERQRPSELPRSLTADDSSRFLAHLFTGPALFGDTEDRLGLFVLNPANAVRFTLAPAPPEPAAGAWPMEFVE